MFSAEVEKGVFIRPRVRDRRAGHLSRLAAQKEGPWLCRVAQASIPRAALTALL